jgi:hypothetical protein
MSKLEGRLPQVRIEVVTAAFVASGRPDGIHDLGRFLESLNNPAVARHIELRDPAVRPLYRAQAQVELDAPMLVRRDQIIFANFEGPHFTHDVVRPTMADVPALLMAPPFQISGTMVLTPGADRTQALRNAIQGFFAVRKAQVYDTEGTQIGEGEQIIVNGAAVQMSAATRRHIDSIVRTPVQQQLDIELDDEQEAQERIERAA